MGQICFEPTLQGRSDSRELRWGVVCGTVPNSQRALVFQHNSLQIVDRQVLSPSSGELLVRILSASLNPIDSYFTLGSFSANGVVPSILGCDAAGVVEVVGAQVSNFKENDRVFYQCDFLDDRTTSFQQYALISADLVAKVPENISLDGACTLGITGGTAAIGMYHTRDGRLGMGLTPPWTQEGRGKYARQPFLVVGGSSSIGQYAIQLARVSGFSPIITTSSLVHSDYLKSLGASHVLDRSLSVVELQRCIRGILGSSTMDYALDAIGQSSTTAIALHVLSPTGYLASVQGGSGRVQDGKTIINIYGSVHVPRNRDFGQQYILGIAALMESGDIQPNRVEILSGGLSGIPDGLARLYKGSVSGTKLIAHPHDASPE